MSNDLSSLTPVQPEQGKALWVQGKLTGVGIARSVAAAVIALALGACSLGGLGGPYPGVPELQSTPRYDTRGRPEWVPPSSGGGTKTAAPPRVLYRIDAKRYFEDASETGHFCENGSPIYYVDKTLGIRSYVVKMDGASMGVNFIIDAANDQYLIGPATRGNTDCSSGGGSCGGASMPYSTDAGRTWRRSGVRSPTDAMAVGGALAYAVGNHNLASSLDLSAADKKNVMWRYMPEDFTFVARKAPIDTKFHCTEDGKE
jgi:hypothetical protein